MDLFVLGFMSYCSHDPGACLLKINKETGEASYIFAEEGFLSRKKKSYQFPTRSINYCLNYFGIKIDEVNMICTDYMDKKRFNRTSNNYRQLIGDYIRANLKINKNTRFLCCESHHHAHAYSSYVLSGFKESAIVVIDGLGSEQSTHSIFKGTENSLKLLACQKGNGIGSLYTLITQTLGFEAGEEGKTMGLAPYGENHQIMDKNLPNLKGKREGFLCDYSEQMFRNPSPALKFHIKKPNSKEDIYKPYYSRLAFNLQNECEEAVKYIVDYALNLTNSQNLCFSGGVALNCVANEIISKRIKNNFFVQPASGDTGIPLGLALYGAAEIVGSINKIKLSKRNFNNKNSPPFVPYIIDNKNSINIEINDFDSEGRIEKFISNYGEPFSLKKVASLLSSENVGCLYYQGIEIGPRALGHRSFLAGAGNIKMKEIMNKKIKHREPYRPFAPIILKEHFDDYFIGKADYLYEYMLGAVQCTEVCKKKAPAIVHVDNTARVQTVTVRNGLIENILREYYKLTGIPILINTSFNDNNEPIVFSKLDAILCFMRTNADFLIIDESLIERSSINDINKYSSLFSEIQQNWIDFYTEKSLKSLTDIGSNKTVNLKKFTTLNLELTDSYRKNLSLIRLIDFLDSCKFSKLITDNYHIKIIKEISKIFPTAKFLEDLQIELINDDITNLNLIKPKENILLYNLSIYLESSPNNFYRSFDKILPSLKLKDIDSSSANDLISIINSYETNQSNTIEEWFKLFTNYKVNHK